ncbi:MAG: hypothetical protein RDU14_03090 [Melioribacteraceae bacterium]|nr:hypothetical protein [Melioribacteraceae bacterium]
MSEHNNVSKESPKNRIGYGVKVPFLSFEDVIELTKSAGTKAEDINSLDVLSRLTGNSISSSNFNQKIATLKNYGVFTFDKTSYSLTGLGKRIANPDSFESQANDIIEVFANQENLKKIWDSYKGKLLPQKEYLANAIVGILGIPPALKLNWAEYFINALKYAGLLEERGAGSYQVLSGYVSGFVPSDNKETDSLPDIKQDQVIKVINKSLPQITYQNFELPSGKKFYFHLDEGYGLDDLEFITDFFELKKKRVKN